MPHRITNKVASERPKNPLEKFMSLAGTEAAPYIKLDSRGITGEIVYMLIAKRVK
jgi:hypothetical protein